MERLSRTVVRNRSLSIASAERGIERIVQFGEGVFLRAFCDWMIDRAIEEEGYDGRIVIVTPRSDGRLADFAAQEGLYTLYLQGEQEGTECRQKRIISAVSRVLGGRSEWEKVCSLAEDRNIEIILSNTTEAGIVFCENDRMEDAANASFCGRLCLFLYRRYKSLGQSEAPGFLLLPCELIENNGEALRQTILQYAAYWNLPDGFQRWILEKNTFASTLVDRIVTGYPVEEAEALQTENGYEDRLMVAAEPFAFWAIEGDEDLRNRLPFASEKFPVMITGDLTFYKQRKVGLLNAVHTTLACAALLDGLETVGECMNDHVFTAWIRHLLNEEILPVLSFCWPDHTDELIEFARSIPHRFSNPYVHHALKSITLNTTSKWRTRVLPILEKAAILQKNDGHAVSSLPWGLCMGLCADFLYGMRLGEEVKDEASVKAFFSRTASSPKEREQLWYDYLGSKSFWGCDLTKIPGLTAACDGLLKEILQSGISDTIRRHLS